MKKQNKMSNTKNIYMYNNCIIREKYVHLYVQTTTIIMMKIVTTRDIARKTKQVFELAEKQQVSVKRGDKYVILMISDSPNTQYFSKEYMSDWMNIPEQYRCNPFDFSPTGDLFFADKRNVEKILESKKGNSYRLNIEDEKKLFEL